MKTPIYLDYSATTPVDPRVAQKMIPFLTEHFGNPARRSHPFGWESEKAVEEARAQIAALVSCDPKEIVLTSGATEATTSPSRARRTSTGQGPAPRHGEDRAQGDARHVRELEREGFEVTYLDVRPDGLPRPRRRSRRRSSRKRSSYP